MASKPMPALTEEEEAALHDMLVRYARGFDVQPYEQAVAVRLIRAAERERVLAALVARIDKLMPDDRICMLDGCDCGECGALHELRLDLGVTIDAALRGQTEEGQDGE